MFLPLHSYHNSWKKTGLHRFHRLLGWQPVHRRLHRQQSRSFRRCPEFIFKKTHFWEPSQTTTSPDKLSPIHLFFWWTWTNNSDLPITLLHSSLSCFASPLSKGIFIIKNASAKPWTPKPTGRCRRLERRASTSKVREIKDVPLFKKKMKSKPWIWSWYFFKSP